jgi:RNA 2',3'-cyclic 3'-phosphodiesterase
MGVGGGGIPWSPSCHTAGVRLFVAVRPPEPALDRVAALRRPAQAGVRWTTRAQWHVTLRFLGEVTDPAPVAAALDGASLPGAEGRLGPAVGRLGREVVMVPVHGLDALAAAVVSATAAAGLPPDRRAFRGHLTLARVRHGPVRALVGEAIDLGFPVEDVRLVRSHLGPDGARYEDLHVRPVG